MYHNTYTQTQYNRVCLVIRLLADLLTFKPFSLNSNLLSHLNSNPCLFPEKLAIQYGVKSATKFLHYPDPPPAE